MDLKANKKELRKEKIRAREALSEEDRIRFSADICGRIVRTPEYAEASTVFVYKWVRGEVRLDELEKQAASDGKRLIYPLCVSQTEMLAVEPGAGDDAWTDSGYMGIMEPVAEKGTATDPADIDLVIAPCSSFDERCGRLGMGGGFYDRYLPKCVRARIIAAAFETQRSEEIPLGEYDFPVDAVATEERLIRR
ncbi:MAG: 5-formyltetrahydrofolate cyclo-ligase [Mogibacterium sp.]|nr:5-formyltetrahydrofolate cyclo-ligase [Mogibacterium sp.]